MSYTCLWLKNFLKICLPKWLVHSPCVASWVPHACSDRSTLLQFYLHCCPTCIWCLFILNTWSSFKCSQLVFFVLDPAAFCLFLDGPWFIDYSQLLFSKCWSSFYLINNSILKLLLSSQFPWKTQFLSFFHLSTHCLVSGLNCFSKKHHY